MRLAAASHMAPLQHNATQVEATKCVVPFGCLYKPLQPMEQMPVVPYDPQRCKSCAACLNPYARVDFQAKLWICPFCYTRNHFPTHYANISPESQPAELYPNYTTIEYTVQQPNPPPPAFLFVLDVCQLEQELAAVRASLTQALSLLPENARVGLITFGTHVHVHELGFAECAKSYVFRGSGTYTREAVAGQLGLTGAAAGQQAPGATGTQAGGQGGAERFLLPVSECEFQLTTLLEELTHDAFPVQPEQRPARCTGPALAVATGLLGSTAAGSGGHILLLLAGPATEGQGTVVSRENADAVRSWKDINKGSAPFYNKARKYYEALGQQLVANGHVLDVFACALDQCGLAEMKVCVEATGGHMVLAESFHHEVFKKSFQQLFSAEVLGLAFNATYEVFASKDVKILGNIGPCASLGKRTPFVADASVGVGGTAAWKIAGIDASTTLATYFEVGGAAGQQQAPGGAAGGMGAGAQFFLQFVTRYTHANGSVRCRVTTITRRWSETASPHELVPGFDQEAAAVLAARHVCWKMESEDDYDATRSVDRMLIRLCSTFGEYNKDDPASFRLPPQLSIFPQFMFNLRRSQFLQVFGNSPDETVYFRSVLNREAANNALVMIQPTLLSFSMGAAPEPALLDVSAIQPDRILLLDAYFSLVVFHGTTIAQWRKANYHHQPEYESFAAMLGAPQEEARAIISERFPVPRFVDCDQNGSQARFLLAKLNPSNTHNAQNGGTGGEVIFTDDVSLQTFMDHLRARAVASSS